MFSSEEPTAVTGRRYLIDPWRCGETAGRMHHGIGDVLLGYDPLELLIGPGVPLDPVADAAFAGLGSVKVAIGSPPLEPAIYIAATKRCYREKLVRGLVANYIGPAPCRDWDATWSHHGRRWCKLFLAGFEAGYRRAVDQEGR
jgi:hypothetical protein